MTESARPISETKITKIRKVKYKMPGTEHDNIIIAYLRKQYPNFRGFVNEDFEFSYSIEGDIEIEAFKEELKG